MPLFYFASKLALTERSTERFRNAPFVILTSTFPLKAGPDEKQRFCATGSPLASVYSAVVA